MTIAIKIENRDSRENAIVSVKTVNKVPMPSVSSPGTQLKGGEETIVYVHSEQSIVIEEVQNG